VSPHWPLPPPIPALVLGTEQLPRSGGGGGGGGGGNRRGGGGGGSGGGGDKVPLKVRAHTQ